MLLYTQKELFLGRSFVKHTLLIGAHTSASGGSFHALDEGEEIGANTIQLFTSNQKQWHGRTISEEEIALFTQRREETGISSIMSHASYLINLGSPNPDILAKSRKAFQQEIKRCHLLDIKFLNFHPGAYTTGSEEQCIDTIIDSLLDMKNLLKKGSTELLLETTAGQGTCVGHTFEQLHLILQATHEALPIGVCLDTCHVFAAGYDISSKEGWESTLENFEQVIGLKYLKAFHLNDSKHPLGSRKDRHANLGEGHIGLPCFQFLMQDPRVQGLPKYLETPDGKVRWKEEIALLRRFAKEE